MVLWNFQDVIISLKCERAIAFQYAEFNALALCRLINSLRGEQRCFCDISQILACDSFNWTILISFYDGVKWVLRSPRDDGAIKSDELSALPVSI